ncbi:hypothetical protein [Streptomyces sp. TRM64462]|uniref:hypothetical protein n=1 Tax=Streptomyces sp. TRM64462 TaxID=2741726 RepID=UPI00158673F0|nr:hypothetical protein [Streptomyces sp. TRM64462]
MPARVPAAPAAPAVRSVAALAAMASFGLTGCGGPFDGLSGPQILTTAIETTKQAGSVTLDVTRTAPDGHRRAYLTVGSRGRCAGTLTVGSSGTMELIRTGDVAYVRFDEAFLRAERKDSSPDEIDRTFKELRGRWMKTDASAATGTPGTSAATVAGRGIGLCDLDALLTGLESGAGSARRGEETTVDGHPALRLTASYGGTTATAYVATDGAPYLLKLVTRGGDEPGTVTFSRYDKPAPVRAPAARDIVETGSAEAA